MRSYLTILTLTMAILLAHTSVRSADYQVQPKDDTVAVAFESTAKLEFIKGETNAIEGSLTFNPARPTDSVSGIFKVDLRELKTGIDTRDGHMREQHLHTDKYPFAWFVLTGVEGMPLNMQGDTTYAATGSGRFYIHGVWREIAVSFKFMNSLTMREGGGLSVRTEFAIKLDDFGIDRPRALFLKLAETIKVSIVVNAFESEDAEPLAPPDWPKAQ